MNATGVGAGNKGDCPGPAPHCVQAAFDDAAAGYDALRRRLIPPFDRFYGAAVDALALARRPVRRVLDLGAGTGILSARIAAAYPGVELVLVDGAPAMLEEARGKLAGTVIIQVGDLRDPLPGGSFDAVVSALAIHHLQDTGKRDLYARAHDALAPGGVFVNAEQVAGATPLLDRAQRAWHRAASLALGTTADEWAAAEERMRHDRCSPVDPQLAWLREAGFADVDCPFREQAFAVLAGRRAG